MSWIQNRKKPIQVETTQTLTKAQGTIMGRSFGYATLGFVILALVTAGLTCAWQFGIKWSDDDVWSWSGKFQGLNIGLTIGSFVLTITSAILAMFWQAKLMSMQNAKGMTLLVWGFFIVGQAFAFSWLMFMLNNTIWNRSGREISLWWVCPAAFGLAFVLFGIFSIIGYSLSNKGQLTVKKMMMAIGIAFAIMMLPMLIFMFMAIWMPWGAGTMYWLCFLMMILFLVLTLLSVMSIIGYIKRCDQFAQLNVPAEQQGPVVKNLSLMFGFSLLVEFVCLVWLLIWLILSVMGLSRRI